jgi:hypothetical protein
VQQRQESRPPSSRGIEGFWIGHQRQGEDLSSYQLLHKRRAEGRGQIGEPRSYPLTDVRGEDEDHVTGGI